ncbi:MAG: curli assembly protein CsgF [Microbacteriaceae bacterium]|nr:curli assembly protein CsgF [Burkholderiaceae bacterium]
MTPSSQRSTSPLLAALLAALLGLAAAPAGATDLVYTPVNPSFGGNPNNAPGLLATAQAQNPYKAPTNTPLQNFNSSLQQAILSRLTSQSLSYIFGANSKLVPGTYDTLAYTISITDSGNGALKISTLDKKTGAVVSFEVSSSELAVEQP